MIGGGEEAAGLWVAVGRGSLGWFPGWGARGPAEWSHIHPFGRPRGAGAMTMPSGDRAAQSVRRARQGRLRLICELARARRPLRACFTASPAGPAQVDLRARPGQATPGLFHRVPVWAAGAAAGCATACSASVSRCQARVASLRATAVVAIFFPRRLAMAW